jgi:glycosyltransferase involved in cell wall biosynthesis
MIDIDFLLKEALSPADQNVCLVFQSSVPDHECQQLLQHKAVGSLMLPAAETAQPKADIGFLYDDATWHLPQRAPNALFFMDARPENILGWRRQLSAYRRGIFKYMYIDEHFMLRKKALLGYSLRYVGEKLANAVRQRVLSDAHHAKKSLSKLNSFSENFAYVPTPGKKVLINTSLSPGGAERQVVNTVLGFHEKGISADLWCERLGDEYYGFYLSHIAGKVAAKDLGRTVPESLQAIYRDSTKKRLYQSVIDSRKMAFLKKKVPLMIYMDVLKYVIMIIEEAPEVVHTWQDYTNITAGLAAHLLGVPTVVMGTRNVTPRNFAYYHPFMGPIYRFLMAQKNVKMLNNSIAGARDYEEWLALPANTVHVLYNGVYPLPHPSAADVAAWRAQHGLPMHKKVVGVIMRFYPEKDPALWIETAKHIHQAYPDCVFLMIGDGILRDQMVQDIAAAGLDDVVFMPGGEKAIQLPLACMDAFLLTSKFEGLPNVLIEAQLMGVPVVTTCAGGAAETLVDGETGYAIATRDAAALAARVVQVLEKSAADLQNPAHIQALAETRFGVGRMVDETITLYG